MKQDYFIFNGGKYHTGTVFIITHCNYKPIKAVFICYDTTYEKYTYKLMKDNQTWHVSAKQFEKWIVSTTDEVDKSVRIPQVKYLKDSQVIGMPVGWLWYIVLMLFGVIVKGCIIWWIFISVVFFSWRRKKMNKEGTYIEW